ncbi:MAG: hypothetical protein ACK5SX_12750, partial [Sandaracinobacter sp.]
PPAAPARMTRITATSSGAPPSRTRPFRHETLPPQPHQPVGTVNYPMSKAYTRITEDEPRRVIAWKSDDQPASHSAPERGTAINRQSI